MHLALRGRKYMTAAVDERDIYALFVKPDRDCIDGNENPMTMLKGSYSMDACFEDCTYQVSVEFQQSQQ